MYGRKCFPKSTRFNNSIIADYWTDILISLYKFFIEVIEEPLQSNCSSTFLLFPVWGIHVLTCPLLCAAFWTIFCNTCTSNNGLKESPDPWGKGQVTPTTLNRRSGLDMTTSPLPASSGLSGLSWSMGCKCLQSTDWIPYNKYVKYTKKYKYISEQQLDYVTSKANCTI